MTYTKTTLSLMVAAIFVVGFTAQDAFAVPVENPTNGNHYDLISAPGISWTDANNAANALTFNGVSGHLVTITSASENAFVGALSSVDFRPWIGLTDKDVEGTFAWVTGEPVVYTNWSSGEPNGSTTENYVEFFASGVWNDNRHDYPVITGYVVEFEKPTTSDPLNQVFDKLTDILNAITGVQNTVDRIETAVSNVGPTSVERVSVTVALDEIYLENGEVIVLLDTTGSGTLSTVHVTANLPCDYEGAPLFNVEAGVNGVSLSGVLTEAADNTGFNGPSETCVFRDTVSADTLGHDITDVILINPGIAREDNNERDRHYEDHDYDDEDSYDYDDKHYDYDDEHYDDYDYESKYLEGVIVTITGTYN